MTKGKGFPPNLKKSPLHLKTALMHLVSEFGDVVVENGIVTVTCPDGSVWDFTEPLMVKVGKIPKLNKWEDTILSVRGRSESAATYKADLAEKTKDLEVAHTLIAQQLSEIATLRSNLGRAYFGARKFDMSVGDGDLGFLSSPMLDGQLELRIRYYEGWHARVVLLSRTSDADRYQQMMAFYTGMPPTQSAPTAITIFKAKGRVPALAINMVSQKARSFRFGQSADNKEQQP